ncbi:MAG TPA: sulfatase [Bryobacteraceae bacterium]|nr:sulfatase [Bryobacteraceae bacterium]
MPRAWSQTAPRQPNILFALADDWMWPLASIAGDSVVKTPTFDKLAGRGVMFTNAFVAAPSCSPSRAAMLTGQWHWRLEEGANLLSALPAKFPVYPDLLEKSGYHIGFTRKGWGPGSEAASQRSRNPAGPRFKDFAAFLEARPKGKPFCFWFGSTDPHRQYKWETGVRSGMKLADVKVPPYLPDSEIVRKDICDYYFAVQRFDRETGELLEMLDRIGELENTLVVMSGDNGWPFPRSKATLYEQGTHVPLAIAWPGKIPPARVVEDFVSLSDLAPTFLEAAGLKPPPEMTGRSLMPILKSRKSGRVESKRDHVLTGMERHVPCRGETKGGYPMRAIRNGRYHYIRNFKPDRWPGGDPNGLEKPGAQPFTYKQLAANTGVGLADIDSGPAKADLTLRREEPSVKPLYEMSAGKRPGQELYDLRNDPYQLHNVAKDPKYAAVVKKLDAQLMAELRATADPRVGPNPDIFDSYPVRVQPGS